MSYESIATASLWSEATTNIESSETESLVRAIALRKESTARLDTKGSGVPIADLKFQMRNLGTDAPSPGSTKVRARG